MTDDIRSQYIEQYIRNVAISLNNNYSGIVDDDKIRRAIQMFTTSNYLDKLNIESEEMLQSSFSENVKPDIDKLINEMIENYLEFQRQAEEFMKMMEQNQKDELATLDMDSEQNGIYLSQQQIDLLMITDISSKEELKIFVENICGQFPNKGVKDIISDFDSITTPEELEQAKHNLYENYQESLISYLENAQISDIDKAKVKLSKLGIEGQELEECINKLSEGKKGEVIQELSSKDPNFITKFNHLMRDDFENIKGVSYEEMKSLSELIKRDDSIDTIIIATGKYDNSMYSTLSGVAFDPYLTQKGLEYCVKNGKHMRYHALFDHAHVDELLKQGKGLQDHDQILSNMRTFVMQSMSFIEQANQKYPGVINTVEIFNELVEKNKPNKNEPYEMVWEKYFGITTDEIVSCFDDIQKPNGVEFMYNETTLTESRGKRNQVEKVLFAINQKNPALLDKFGDQMHLSDEDVMTKEGRTHVEETAQMLKRISNGQVIVNGETKNINQLRTECTEHDFHFTREFLQKTQNKTKDELWATKRGMQKYVSDVYTKNGVKFDRVTYWSMFGKNDHNYARNNIEIQKENMEREKNGLPIKPLLDTMSAGIVKDGNTFDNKALKKQKKEELQHNENKNKPFKMTVQEQHLFETKTKTYQSIQQRLNQPIQDSNEMKKDKPMVRVRELPKPNTPVNNSQGISYSNGLIILICACLLVIIVTIIFLLFRGVL